MSAHRMRIAMGRAGAPPGQISRPAVEFFGERRQPGTDGVVSERMGKLAVTFRVVAEVSCIVHFD
jgi:hypothetical protein